MLPSWLVVVILGIIEGLTEFIPVSSTGHLLIAQHWLGHQSDLFNIVIQCGAVLAVLPLFRRRLAMLSRWREPASRDMILKIGVAFFITAVFGFVIDKLGFQLPETVKPVAIALAAGGVVFIVVEMALKGKTQSNEITWAIVVLVAIGQLIAGIFPGTSRSGTTIIIAMIAGLGRVPATEFSFLVGIPTMLAAGGYKILKALHAGAQENWSLLFLATIVAAVVSFLAVKWLLRYVQSHTFIGFGIYRIILAILLILVLGSQL